MIKGTATARSGQLTMPCPVCAQRRYDDVIGNFPGLINTINARLPLGDIFLTGTPEMGPVTGLGS